MPLPSVAGALLNDWVSDIAKDRSLLRQPYWAIQATDLHRRKRRIEGSEETTDAAGGR